MIKETMFYSDGVALSARVCIPEDHPQGEKLPGIVVCFGYSGDARFDPELLEIFAKAGYFTLTFDYRGFGKSGGAPGRFIPMEQVRDIRSAITYLSTFPEVNMEQIGLYGRSWGGANVVYTAGIDPRPRCIVSTSGIGNGERWLRSLRSSWEWAEFLERLKEDRIKRVLTGISEHVPFDEIMVPEPKIKEMMTRRVKKANSQIERPLESADATIDFRAEDMVHKISPRPVLFIHGGSDTLVLPEESESMYEKAGNPKKLVIFPGAVHQDFYGALNPTLFRKVLALAIEWFTKYLKGNKENVGT